MLCDCAIGCDVDPLAQLLACNFVVQAILANSFAEVLQNLKTDDFAQQQQWLLPLHVPEVGIVMPLIVATNDVCQE